MIGCFLFFFFKQKTAYEWRISDWSSDVCSSDLSLYDSDTNIAIGTAYLRQMEDKYGQTYFAIAAYNDGPSPVARWQSQHPGMDPDFWIETISDKETRDYVARVLAVSVIYDWRMDGDALPGSQERKGPRLNTSP